MRHTFHIFEERTHVVSVEGFGATSELQLQRLAMLAHKAGRSVLHTSAISPPLHVCSSGSPDDGRPEEPVVSAPTARAPTFEPLTDAESSALRALRLGAPAEYYGRVTMLEQALIQARRDAHEYKVSWQGTAATLGAIITRLERESAVAQQALKLIAAGADPLWRSTAHNALENMKEIK